MLYEFTATIYMLDADLNRCALFFFCMSYCGARWLVTLTPGCLKLVGICKYKNFWNSSYNGHILFLAVLVKKYKMAEDMINAVFMNVRALIGTFYMYFGECKGLCTIVCRY